MKNQLITAMADLDEDTTLALVENALRTGRTPTEVVELCKKGVEIVGKRYAEGEYFLSDLIMSEEIFKEVMKRVEPILAPTSSSHHQSVVIGTIEGDIHDLGKNIMVYLLRSSGYQVYDLGVDVAPETFVNAVNETKSGLLGISVLLTFCIGSVKKVINLLEETGLRNQVKVVLGGYPVNELVKTYTGVDYYTNDISKAIAICEHSLVSP